MTKKPDRSARRQSASPLMVRLDSESKDVLARAAQLRRVSVSDYVRLVTLGQARREVEAANQQTISLSPDEQLQFWQALKSPPELSDSQRRLGSLMRGEM